MRWLQSSPAAARAAGKGDANAIGEQFSSHVHDSPALAEFFATLDPDRPIRVLDLGPALRTNLEFYSSFASGVRIAHLLRGDDLEGFRHLDPGPSDLFLSIMERLAPGDEEPFGLILVWDLLNYLVGEQPTVLTHHLAAVAERGARIHAMTITAETMPAEPSCYEFMAPGCLNYRPITRRRTNAPDPPAAQVERWLDPFRITRSFVLRHGVREYLGVFD